MVQPTDLTDEMIVGFFGEHCECRPVDVDRTSHSHDCDIFSCEDARVALGGLPTGCLYRSTTEAINHIQAARQRIAANLKSGSDLEAIATSGRQLLDNIQRLRGHI